MSEPVLELGGVAAGYGATRVLSGIDVAVARGEAVALLGTNGAGKTTLLKVACGALAPLEGSVCLMGEPLARLGPRETARRVSFVPQSEAPAFDVTVRELVLTARLPWSHGVFETREDHAQVDEAMGQAGCTGLADRAVSTLSGGEFQRALIARALAQQTPLVLLDEPTNHLDPAHQVQAAELVSNLVAMGRVVIATSHDLDWALGAMPRAVLLHQGRVAYDGPSAALVELDVLDEAYGVRFARLRDAHGRLALRPYALGGG